MDLRNNDRISLKIQGKGRENVRKETIKSKTDFFTGIGIILFCSLVLTQMFALPFEVKMFPRAVMLIGVLIGLALILKSIVQKKQEEAEKGGLSTATAAEGILLLWIYGVLLLAEKLGLFTAAYLVITSISCYLCYQEYGKNFKKMALMAGYNVAIIAVMYILFKIVLGLRVPDGLLF